MNTFPILRTGALTQYPAKAATTFSTQVLRFVDGSEQRFPGYAAALHGWTVQLDLLDEDETTRLTEFFAAVSGPEGSFAFTDPSTGTVYSDCSFVEDDFSVDVQPADLGKTALLIRENRS